MPDDHFVEIGKVHVVSARVATRHFAPCVELFTHISIVVITLCSSLNLVRNACIAQKN